LCSAVITGKGDDLIRFLSDTEIPKDKWPSLLAKSDSLSSAVVNGEGGDLLSFLSDTEMPKDI